eukprot:TRINITY_DN21081_c0_g1_i2.p1 TRINITY_DN21081_c0_g1~~TRINITY_DN21081_c0_g1_i2.p1  ORF type:complete len:779 (+),score=189.79 TRINITY_DN21081_c0_g1_i2:59-2395(+)
MSLQPVVLSDTVNATLAEVFPSDDPFDDPNFDPLAFINERFPSEKSLRGLGDYMESLEAGARATEEEVRETVRGQAGGASRAEMNLEEAKGSIQELFKKVEEIRRMAEESEAMVMEICTEISSLDNAKKNLTDAITILKKMKDISKGLDELKASTDQQPADLAAAAENLTLCRQILEKHFSNHSNLPRVKELSDKLSRELKICSQLALQELKTIDVHEEEVPPSVIDACAVADACGDEIKTAAVTAFVQANIEKYKKAFLPGSDEARLEKMERRFAWFRRLLKSFEDNLSGHIPVSWCIQQELGVEFCLATREDIKVALEQEGGGMNIEILVRVLQKAIDFEKDLTARMQIYEKNAEKEARRYRGTDPHALRSKYNSSAVEESQKTTKKYKYTGFITSCFEHTMDAYVSHEGVRMNTAIRTLVREQPAMVDGQQTLPTALEIFSYIKQSLKKCSAFCKDEILVKMHRVWSENLIFYGDELRSQIASSGSGDDLKTCIIINSADWCVDTATKLAEEVRSCIDESCHAGVKEEAPTETFLAVIQDGTMKLVGDLIEQLGPQLTEMVQTPWYQHEEVGDQSDYVSKICSVLSEVFPKFGKNLKPNLFKHLCVKFVDEFVPRYVRALYGLKRPTPSACRQLLLDIQILKSQFPKIPFLGDPERFRERELKAYNMLVRISMGRGEAILKFLESEIPPSEGTILADQYSELLQDDGSVTDFLRLLEMKGIGTKEQKPLREYLEKTKGMPLSSKRNNASHSDSKGTDTIRRFRDGMNKIKDKLKE